MMRTMPAKDKTLAAFGRDVARCQAERGFLQERLAEEADLDCTSVSGIERDICNPGIRTVLRVARAFNVNVSEFFKGVGV